MSCPPRAKTFLAIALRHSFILAVVVWLLLNATVPTSAQGVVGHLYDSETGIAVTTADVVMTNEVGDTVGRAISDATGGFVILVETLGEYSLFVSRLGYVSQASSRIFLTEATLQDLEIMIHPDAVGIEGLVVSTTRRVNWLRRQGFYERKRSAIGEFVQPTDTEKMQTFSTTGLLRSVSGLRTSGGQVLTLRGGSGFSVGPCALKVFLNGIAVGFNLDGAVISSHVLAIEVYKSLHNVPAQYLSMASARIGRVQSCGAVLVWTEVGGNR